MAIQADSSEGEGLARLRASHDPDQLELDQVLPIFIGLASLSFLIGLALQRSWLEHAPIWQATLGGALSGGVASFLLLADAVIRRFDGMQGVAGFVVGILLFWAGPACVAAFVFMLLHRYSSVRAV
jgi:hypothetical protein